MNEVKEYTEKVFENIKHVDENNHEYWLARDLMPLLEYSKWENFNNVIQKAVTSYKNSNNDDTYWLPKVRKPIITGKGKEELEFGLKKYNYKVSTINKRIEDSLKMVNLPKEYLDKSPFELSSGEKESLALGIVLSLNPKLIIIDNPTSNLDSRNKEYLIKLLKKIKTRYNKTIILLTSDIEFTIKVTDNYLILKNDKIISSGVKKELLNNISKIKTSKVEIPKIIDFINAVKKKKNINLELTFDIKELMKDIYRNVK